MKNAFFSDVLRIKVHLREYIRLTFYALSYLQRGVKGLCRIWSASSTVADYTSSAKHKETFTISVFVCVFEMSVFKFSLSIGFNYVHNISWHVCLFVDFSDAKETYTDVIARLSSCTTSTSKSCALALSVYSQTHSGRCKSRNRMTCVGTTGVPPIAYQDEVWTL